MSEYAVFVKLEGVIYVEAESPEQAVEEAKQSGMGEVSWNEWFEIENAQLEEA